MGRVFMEPEPERPAPRTHPVYVTAEDEKRLAELTAENKRLRWMMTQVHILDRTEHSCPKCDKKWSDLARRYRGEE